jgi:hypothetical protein
MVCGTEVWFGGDTIGAFCPGTVTGVFCGASSAGLAGLLLPSANAPPEGQSANSAAAQTPRNAADLIAGGTFVHGALCSICAWHSGCGIRFLRPDSATFDRNRFTSRDETAKVTKWLVEKIFSSGLWCCLAAQWSLH